MNNSILKAILVAVAMIVVTVIAKKALSKIKAKNNRLQTSITILESTIQYVAAIVGLIWVLSILGVDVSAILASVGIIALVVGFSAESLIADVITGIFMIFENQFNVGDVVEIDGFRGTVTQVGIRTISVQDSGNNTKIVNNSNIKNVVNLSSASSTAVTDITIIYDQDLEEVEKRIEVMLPAIYETHKDVFQSAPQYIGIQDFLDFGMKLRFVADVDEKDIFSGRRILNHEIYMGFVKNGINVLSRK